MENQLPTQLPTQKSPFLSNNKGLVIAVIIGIAIAIIGASAFIGFNSADQYQGMIERMDRHTKNLQN